MEGRKEMMRRAKEDVRIYQLALMKPSPKRSPNLYFSWGSGEDYITRNFNDLYSSPNIIRVIKSRRMTSAGHVARIGKKEVHTGFWWGDLREGDHLEDPGVDGRLILKWIFKKW
jgi:hypothetical protein